MVWLLVAGLILGALLVLVLVLPLRLRARAESEPARLRVDLRLFGGLARLALVDTDRPRRAGSAPATGRKTARRPRRRPSSRVVRAGAGAALEALVRVRVEVLRGEARVGLGDPALTGEFWGRAAGVLAALPVRGLRLVPLFDRQALEGEGEAVLSLVPARLLPVAARFLWSIR
ncbi:MAG: hypothetical protein KDK12_04595 [Rhodobacteraceae bacterium]|nr:hypothetical protein [Paracoccaceae bacterium]